MILQKTQKGEKEEKKETEKKEDSGLRIGVKMNKSGFKNMIELYDLSVTSSKQSNLLDKLEKADKEILKDEDPEQVQPKKTLKSDNFVGE